MRLKIFICLVILSFSLRLLSAEAEQEYYEPGITLPEGEGRQLVLAGCTGCHTLEGVPAFRNYWGYERWLPMVENMVKHGAELNQAEIKEVAKYLGKYYGTDE